MAWLWARVLDFIGQHVCTVVDSELWTGEYLHSANYPAEELEPRSKYMLAEHQGE